MKDYTQSGKRRESTWSLLGRQGFFAFILCIACSGAAHAHVCEATGGGKCWYAAPGASGVGTEADPAELHSILPQMSAGDYMYLRGGTYDEQHSWGGRDWPLNLELRFDVQEGWADPQPSASEPVTIKSYTGETAIFTTHYNGACGQIDISFVTLEDLTFMECEHKGIAFGEDNEPTDLTARNLTIHNVKYTDNSGFIYVQNGTNITIENSTFYDYTPRDDGYSGLMLKFYKSKNILVQNNSFSGIGGGIYYKHGHDAGGTTKIIGNTFRNMTRRAIRTNQTGTEITGNVFDNGGSISVHEQDGTTGTYTYDVKITYNTFIDSSIVLNKQDNDSDGLGARNGTVANNVMKNTSYSVWRYWTGGEFDTGLTSDNNCYYQSGGSQGFIYFNTGSHDLSTWQERYGYDTNSIEANPLLQADYTLGAGSPCAAMGHTAYGEFDPASLPKALPTPLPPTLF